MAPGSSRHRYFQREAKLLIFLDPRIRHKPLATPFFDEVYMLQPSPNLFVRMIENNYLEAPRCLHADFVEQREHLSDRDYVFVLPWRIELII